MFTSSDQLSEKKGSSSNVSPENLSSKRGLEYRFSESLCKSYFSHEHLSQVSPRDNWSCLCCLYQGPAPEGGNKLNRPKESSDGSTEATGRLKRTKSHVSLPWPSPIFPSSACRCPWWQPRFRSWQTKPYVKCVAQQEALPEMDERC